jgi:hypothetical protein
VKPPIFSVQGPCYGSDDGDDNVNGPAVIAVNDGDDAGDEYF